MKTRMGDFNFSEQKKLSCGLSFCKSLFYISLFIGFGVISMIFIIIIIGIINYHYHFTITIIIATTFTITTIIITRSVLCLC